MGISKKMARKKIHMRIRKRIHGSSVAPRLSVFRSNKHIYCQVINDAEGKTLCAVDSSGLDAKLSKIEMAHAVGKAIAEKAKSAGIDRILFDRSGYLYHGRVKALAEGAREGGLQF